MELFGKQLNFRMIVWFGIHALIIVDIILITAAMLWDLPKDIAMEIMIFDFVVCIILLCEWFLNLYMSKPKKLFLKQKGNWVSLIASIPFDVILPTVVPGISLLRYLRLLKLLRIAVLLNRFFDGFRIFIKKSNMDKILGLVIFVIIFFTLLLYFFGPTYGIFDDFYFVIVTLTTVGYGDVTPVTYNEKLIAILLIIAGIFIFSTITAAISSFLTERLLDGDEEQMEDEIKELIEEKFDNVNEELKNVHEENQMLKNEIEELKELIKNK